VGVVDYVVAGPVGMLVLQATCFLAAVYLALRRAFEPRPAAWIAAAVFVFPPVLVPFSVIWKDPLMAGLPCCSASPACCRPARPRLLACSDVRGGRRSATTRSPRRCRSSCCCSSAPGLHWLKRYAIGGRRVARGHVQLVPVQRRDHRPPAAPVALDCRVRHRRHARLCRRGSPDAELTRLFEGTDLLVKENIHATARELYTPKDFLPITNHPTKTMWSLPINGYVAPPEAQRDAITRAWKETLSTTPSPTPSTDRGDGGVHRAGREPGERRDRQARLPVARERPQARLGTGWSKLQRKLIRFYVFVVRHTPVFSVWMYLVVALALLPLALRHRDVLALLLSGLGLETTLVLVAPSPDYRYSHWLVICTIISAILLGIRRYRGRTP